MNIYITNIDPNIIEADLIRLLTPFGEITSLKLLRDKINNRSKGTAVVNMQKDKEGEKAIASLNGTVLGRKPILLSSIPYEDERRHGIV